MKPHLVLTVAALISGLYLGDRSLASLEKKERAGEARSANLHGRKLLAQAQSQQAAQRAIGFLQRAHSLERENRPYQLDFASGLIASGRLPEAESNLRDLLNRDSNDGAANLAMARLAAQSGNNRDAEAYYHRAIYGTWTSGNSAAAVRTELVKFLASHGEQKQLLAELLLLQDSPGATPEDRRNLGRLFVIAGSPSRGADTYRSLLRDNPNDADSYRGMAEAELALGNFSAAQANLRKAMRKQPDNQDTDQLLQLASTLSALDPTTRRLTSQEKYRRSAQLLELAKADAARCPAVAVPDIPDVVPRPAATNESAEALLDQAESLWKARLAACSAPPRTGRNPLPLLMGKVIQ